MKLIESIIVDGKVYDVVKNNADFDDCVKCEFNKGYGCQLEITGICPATNNHYFKRRRTVKRREPKHEEMSRNRQKKTDMSLSTVFLNLQSRRRWLNEQ